jgi:hypothetical protein
MHCKHILDSARGAILTSDADTDDKRRLPHCRSERIIHHPILTTDVALPARVVRPPYPATPHAYPTQCHNTSSTLRGRSSAPAQCHGTPADPDLASG